MCLEIKSGPHIAKKDFYTLKLGELYNPETGRLLSFYWYTEQFIGKTYTSNFQKINQRYIGEGIHSYLCKTPVSPIIIWDIDIAKRVVVLCKIPIESYNFNTQPS